MGGIHQSKANEPKSNAKETNTVKHKANPMVTGTGLTLLVLAACAFHAWAAATMTPFSGTESHVAWLDDPPPKIKTTPSGHLIIQERVHLWYDDADDDRLDGYDTVVIRAMLDADGNGMHARGTFTVREKLDRIPIEDLLSGNFELDEIVQGEVLWEGTWTWQPREGVFAVAHNSEGLKAFYRFSGGGAFAGYILDAHGE